MFIAYAAVGFIVVSVFGALIRRFLGGTSRRELRYHEDGRRVAMISAAYLRRRLERLREPDPNFSTVLFEEFVLALYSQAHARRSNHDRLAEFSAFLRPEAHSALLQWPGGPARSVIVGGLQIRDVRFEADHVRVAVRIDAAHSEHTPRGTDEVFYVSEEWWLLRNMGTPSRPPDRIQIFVCPNCGAALDRMAGAECGYCGVKVDTGAYDWVVESIRLLKRDQEGPAPLFGRLTPGLTSPTEAPADVERRFRELLRREPTLSWEGFKEHVAMVFEAIQKAWATGDFDVMRPFVTDRLLQYELYWIQRQAREGIRGAITGLRLTWIDLVEVASDRYFDHVTVRIFAAKGKLGQRVEKYHAHTEYWTLIRGRAESGRASEVCPSCGAALEVSREGRCGHCGAFVSRGRFDWLLSRIEDQEAYEGLEAG